MRTLGDVAVGIVADASGFGQGLAAAIDQSLTAPLAQAQAAASQTAASLDTMKGVRGPDLSKSVAQTANLSTGINAAARAIDQLDIGVEGLGMTVSQVTSGVQAGGMIGLVTGVVAVVGFALAQVGKLEGRIREHARTIAATILDTESTFAELEANLDKAFTVEQQAQLVAWGYNLREVATDADVLRETLLAIQAIQQQDDGSGMFGIADSLLLQKTTAELAALDEQHRLTGDEAWWSAEQQRRAAESVPGRIAAAVDQIISEYDRITSEGDALRDGLESAFQGWVNVISGVPAQLETTAAEIAANAENIRAAAAQQMLSWTEAVEAGAPNVAQAILDAGPEANAAFAELLNNPELLRATETALGQTADITKRVIDDAVSGLVDPQLTALVKGQWVALGQEGMAGLGVGLEAEAPAVAADIKRIMADLIEVAYGAWDARSPSRKFEELGGEGMRGIEKGIGNSNVPATLKRELQAFVNAATPPARTGGRALGKAIVDSLAESLAEWGDRIRSIEIIDALHDAQAEVTALGQSWTAAEIVAVERAEEHLRSLLETRGEVAAAERDMASAQAELAAAETARRVAAEAWDYAGFQQAEAAREEARRQIEEAQRTLGSRQPSDAEIALAQQQVEEARATPEQARFDATLALERATLAAVQQQVQAGADVATLLRQIAGRPQQVEVNLNLAYSGAPGEAEAAGRQAAEAVVRALVDAIDGR